MRNDKQNRSRLVHLERSNETFTRDSLKSIIKHTDEKRKK